MGRGNAWRVAVPVALALLAAPEASARCMQFDFVEAIEDIPIVVLGRVEASNAPALGGGRCVAEPCRHEARVAVLEVLKGQVDRASVVVRHDYLEQRPEIALFEEGTVFIFAVDEISAKGVATLFGTTCGRSGLAEEELDRVREALRKSR